MGDSAYYLFSKKVSLQHKKWVSHLLTQRKKTSQKMYHKKMLVKQTFFNIFDKKRFFRLSCMSSKQNLTHSKTQISLYFLITTICFSSSPKFLQANIFGSPSRYKFVIANTTFHIHFFLYMLQVFQEIFEILSSHIALVACNNLNKKTNIRVAFFFAFS